MIDYEPHDWRSHLLDVRGSMVLQIIYRVALCVIWSKIVVVLHYSWRPVSISDRGHVLVGIAFGLLLVFRTNASYDRFWEGRKLWGGIVNESRNLGRAAGAFLPDPALATVLLRWAAAFPYATMHGLRGERSLGDGAATLPPADAAAAGAAPHVPMFVACRMSECIADAARRGLVTPYVAIELDRNVQALVQYMGACERIKKTPLPFAYVVHLRRAMILYCFTLPFALLDTYGPSTVVVTLIVAYLFFGIEEIGVQIEEPFGVDDNDLPLERICATIAGDLAAIGPAAAAPAAR